MLFPLLWKSKKDLVVSSGLHIPMAVHYFQLYLMPFSEIDNTYSDS